MRPYGSPTPRFDIPGPPDTMSTILLTGGSSAQAMDWVGAASAGAAGANIVRITPLTTAGAALAAFVNLESTKAAVPSSGTSTLGSSVNIPVVGVARTLAIPPGSTGFSVASYSSGMVMLEVWHR